MTSQVQRSPASGVRIFGAVHLMVRECDVDLAAEPPASFDGLFAGDPAVLARTLTLAEAGRLPEGLDLTPRHPVPVLGITGTGGSGKSSLTDELVRRFRLDQEDKLRIAVLAVDPTRRRGGGALLGDRIRMNSLTGTQVFFRSMATRGGDGALPQRLGEAIATLKAAGFDLVIVETPGIGQGDAGIVPFVDRSLYVMTPEFGAASQLESHHLRDLLAGSADSGDTGGGAGLTVGEGRIPRTDCKTSSDFAAAGPRSSRSPSRPRVDAWCRCPPGSCRSSVSTATSGRPRVTNRSSPTRSADRCGGPCSGRESGGPPSYGPDYSARWRRPAADSRRDGLMRRAHRTASATGPSPKPCSTWPGTRRAGCASTTCVTPTRRGSWTTGYRPTWCSGSWDTSGHRPHSTSTRGAPTTAAASSTRSTTRTKCPTTRTRTMARSLSALRAERVLRKCSGNWPDHERRPGRILLAEPLTRPFSGGRYWD
jgi:hypothetical protein